MKKKYIILISLLILQFLSCNKSFEDFGEQYKKVLYIVNSNNFLFENEHFFENENDFIGISIYCSGTESPKKDISVQVDLNIEALDSLNEFNLRINPFYEKKYILPFENFSFTNKSVIINKGMQYGTLEIPFTMNGLDVDIEYVLPVRIESNSHNYEINPKLNTIIYQINMINSFSGEYSGSSIELPNKAHFVQSYLKAISARSVRMPIHNLPDDKEFLETNYMVLTLDEDSVSVKITPWGNALINDLGNSSYDKIKKRFELHYSFTDADGNEFIIQTNIRNLYAEDDEE